jgi:hypothetical protein
MTVNVETAVINYLLAGSAVAAIVGTRVYPVTRPQGSSLPAVTVTRISGGPLYADDGEVGLDNARLQVDSWGTTYAAAKDLAAAVGDRLSAVRDISQSGVTIRYAMLDTEQDLREPGTDDYEYLFRTRQDYIVWTGG